MRNRGLLTKADRAALRGERDVSADRINDIRYNIRERMDHVEEDLELLQEIGEDELVARFYATFSRAAQLEQRVAELESKLDDQAD